MAGLLDASVAEYVRRRNLADPVHIAKVYKGVIDELNAGAKQPPPAAVAGGPSMPSYKPQGASQGQPPSGVQGGQPGIGVQGGLGLVQQPTGGLLGSSGQPPVAATTPTPPMSAIEKWRQEIEAMMLSGNPTLQKQAIAMMNPYYQKATTTATSKDYRTTSAKLADELGLKGKARNDFIRSHAFRKPYADPGDVPYSIDELSKMQIPDGNGGFTTPPPGYTPNQARMDSAVIKQAQSAGDAGRTASLMTAIEQFPIITETMYTPEGNIDRDVANLSYIFSKDPTANAFASKFIANASGEFSPAQIEKAQRLQQALETGLQAITRTETGAAMAAEEIDNIRKRFQPAVGDPDSVIYQKLKAYEYFLRYAVNAIDPTILKGNDANALAREVNRIAHDVEKQFKVGGGSTPNTIKLEPGQKPEDLGFTKVQ